MIIAGVQCDKCGEVIYWKHTTKQNIVRWARMNGYSIGKECLCEKCRKSKRGGK